MREREERELASEMLRLDGTQHLNYKSLERIFQIKRKRDIVDVMINSYEKKGSFSRQAVC